MTSNLKTVPVSPSLALGQRDTHTLSRDSHGTSVRTPDIKALAKAVFMRDNARDNNHKTGIKSVPTVINNLGQRPKANFFVASPWNAADWQVYFNERAGIAEYDGGLSRTDAEIQTHDECITRWMQLNPPAHDNPDSCLYCGLPSTGMSVNVMNHARASVWLHDECLPPWLANRREEAAAALRVIGVLDYHPTYFNK